MTNSEAIEVLKKNYPDRCYESLQAAVDTAIYALSAQPDRKNGTWVPVTNGRGGHECDQCHNYAPSYSTGEERLSDYCPSCGAKMDEKEKTNETD